MKFVIAPDSYKESMNAVDAAKAIERGILNVFPDAACDILPMADGGEGTADSLMYTNFGESIPCKVTNPLEETVEAKIVWFEERKAALVEVSMACGLMLIPPYKRDPKIATSYGVGEMICEALKLHPKEIIISLGGTGTSDGGAGMLSALGAKLLDQSGKEIPRGGGGLSKIVSADLSEPIEKLKGIKVSVLCDVKNTLLGKKGATNVFAPQKGAKPEDLEFLEAGMKNYAQVVEQYCGRELSLMEGSGAAGGIGFALYAISDAAFTSGSLFVIKALGLEEKIKRCDYVITGEGSIDSQSLGGKVPIGIARLAKKHNKPLLVFAGRIGKHTKELYEQGITAIFCILKGLDSLERTLNHGEYNLQWTVENVMRLLKAEKESD